MLLIESETDQFENSKYEHLKLTDKLSLPGQGSHWGQTVENIFKISQLVNIRAGTQICISLIPICYISYIK